MNHDTDTPDAINRAQIPAMLAVLADQIEANPKNVGAIATGFRLLAVALEPCEDCGAPTMADIETLHPADNPEAGADLVDTATGQVG